MLQMECVLKTMPRIISSNYISTYIIIIEISYFWWYFLIKLQLLWNSICTFLIRNFDFTLFETIIFYDVLTQHFHVSEIKWCSSFAWWLGIKIIELSFDIYRCYYFLLFRVPVIWLHGNETCNHKEATSTTKWPYAITREKEETKSRYPFNIQWFFYVFIFIFTSGIITYSN